MEEPKLLKLPPGAIRWDEEVMSREKSDPKIVDEYKELIQGGTQMPEIDVFFDDDSMWGADGRQRFEAYVALEIDKIVCRVHRGTRADAIWFSAGANLKHGVRPKPGDKKHAVSNVLKAPEWKDRTDTSIAEQTGASPTYVGTVRKKLYPPPKKTKAAAEVEGDGQPHDETADPNLVPIHPPVKRKAKRKGKDGKTQEYDVNVSNIGKKKGSKPKPSAGKAKAAEVKLATDGLKQELAAWAVPIFEESLLLDEFCTQLSGMSARAAELAKLSAGKRIDAKWFADQIQELRRHVVDARVWCQCPDCLPKDHPVVKCEICHGTGMLSKQEYNEHKLS